MPQATLGANLVAPADATWKIFEKKEKGKPIDVYFVMKDEGDIADGKYTTLQQSTFEVTTVLKKGVAEGLGPAYTWPFGLEAPFTNVRSADSTAQAEHGGAAPTCPFCCKAFKLVLKSIAKDNRNGWFCPNWTTYAPDCRGGCKSGRTCSDEMHADQDGYAWVHEGCLARMNVHTEKSKWDNGETYGRMAVCAKCPDRATDAPPALRQAGAVRECLPQVQADALLKGLKDHCAKAHAAEDQHFETAGDATDYTTLGASTASVERVFNSTSKEVALIGMLAEETEQQRDAMMDASVHAVNGDPQHGEGRFQIGINGVLDSGSDGEGDDDDFVGVPALTKKVELLMKWSKLVGEMRPSADGKSAEQRGVAISARILETTACASEQNPYHHDDPGDGGVTGSTHNAVLGAIQEFTRLSVQGVNVGVRIGCQLVINGKVKHAGTAGLVVTGDIKVGRRATFKAMESNSKYGHLRVHFETQPKALMPKTGNLNQLTQFVGGKFTRVGGSNGASRSVRSKSSKRQRKKAKVSTQQWEWVPTDCDFRDESGGV
jgi:hypothetical protein